jgi:dTDP-4-dehydrorhamnose reductase
MKIYILGITGMLGSELFLNFIKNKNFIVKGSTRKSSLKVFEKYERNIDYNVSINNIEKIKKNILSFKPDFVINCIGFIKQKIGIFKDYKKIFYTNTVFPYKIYSIIKSTNIKLIHFSTDCVFNGAKGNYREQDDLSAHDIYGLSKYLGELKYPNTYTIRTSIIGHELNSKFGLLEWFLSKKKCNGYYNFFFSGLTTFQVYNFINKYLLKYKNNRFYGLIHLSSYKISKYKLLKIITKIYNKKIIIKKRYTTKIDRSLNNSLVKKVFLYKPPTWSTMVKQMYLNRYSKLI